MREKLVAVRELKAQRAVGADTARRHADLLFDLSDRSRERRLAGLEPAPGALILPAPSPRFFRIKSTRDGSTMKSSVATSSGRQVFQSMEATLLMQSAMVVGERELSGAGGDAASGRTLRARCQSWLSARRGPAKERARRRVALGRVIRQRSGHAGVWSPSGPRRHADGGGYEHQRGAAPGRAPLLAARVPPRAPPRRGSRRAVGGAGGALAHAAAPRRRRAGRRVTSSNQGQPSRPGSSESAGPGRPSTLVFVAVAVEASVSASARQPPS